MDCVNVPYADASAFTHVRRALARELASPRSGGAPTDPIRAFHIVFATRLDPHLDATVRGIVATAAARRRRYNTAAAFGRGGYVYAFRGVRNTFKVGATRRHDPAQRIAQWRSDLRDDTVTLLFAYPCRAPFVAERIMHTLLECEHVSMHNPHTGRHLNEFFRVGDASALRALVHATTRYIDWLVDAGSAGVVRV